MPNGPKKNKQEKKNNFSLEDQSLLIVYFKKIIEYTRKNGLNKEYLNFIRANVNDAKNNPYFVNSLFNQKNTNKFSAASTLLMSALVAKIKIYKVIERSDDVTDLTKLNFIINGKVDKLRKTYSFLIPFEDHLYLPNNSTGDITLENYFANEFGKAFGSGIKNVNISDGSSTGDAMNITAQIKARFSNFDSLFEEHLVASVEDPNVYTKVTFKDLFQHAQKANENTGTQAELIDNVFRIKLAVGWNYDLRTLKRINFGSNDLTQTDINDLKAALEKCTATYYCNYTKFDIDIEETGAVMLTISYIGANDSIFGSRTADVLYMNQNGWAVNGERYLNDLVKRKKERDDLIKLKNDTKIKDTAKDKAQEKLKKEYEEKIKAELKLLDYQMSFDKYKLHKEFLNNLINNAKIYTIDIPINNIASLREALDPEQKDESVKLKKSFDLYTKAKEGGIEINPILTEQGQKVIESITTLAKTSLNYNAKKKQEKEKELEGFQPITRTSIVKDKRSVNFIFLGDILNYAFGCLKVRESMEYRNIVPIVGNFCTTEPLLPSKQDLEDKNKKFSLVEQKMEEPKVYNYCDLPISVERFKKFLFDNIISKEVEHVTLETFLTELFKQVVNTAFNANIFGNQISRTFGNVLFGQSTLRTYFEDGVEKEFFSGRPYEEVLNRDSKNSSYTGGSYGFSAINVDLEMNPPLFEQEKFSNCHIVNYYYMFSKVFDQVSGKVLSYSDRDAYGIIEMNLGASNGIVKKINFAKTNISGLMESAYKETLGEKRGANPFLMQGVMDAEIEMFGNPFLKAGSMVYLNPSFMLKKPGVLSEAVKRFGLGGYYQIVKIVHDVSDGKFTTKASAKFNHFGDGRIIQAQPTPPPVSVKEAMDKLNSELSDAKRASETKSVDEERQKEAGSDKTNVSENGKGSGKGNGKGKGKGGKK